MLLGMRIALIWLYSPDGCYLHDGGSVGTQALHSSIQKKTTLGLFSRTASCPLSWWARTFAKG